MNSAIVTNLISKYPQNRLLWTGHCTFLGVGTSGNQFSHNNYLAYNSQYILFSLSFIHPAILLSPSLLPRIASSPGLRKYIVFYIPDCISDIHFYTAVVSNIIYPFIYIDRFTWADFRSFNDLGTSGDAPKVL